MARWLTNQANDHEVGGSIPCLRIQRCPELWCRSHMRLKSHIAVAEAQADSYSSDSTPSLGISICHGCGPKKIKDQKKIDKRMGNRIYAFNLV